MGEQGNKEVLFELPPTFYLYKDGTVRRGELRPPLPPSPHDGVSFRELTLNPELGLWARIYLPSPSPPPPSSPSRKFPLVLFFHGGGFIRGSPAESHPYCSELSKRSSSIFVSASYRLAPEHRLPAAFDDGFATFEWLHSQALLQAQGKEDLMDPWLAHADFSKFFLAGLSAGASVAHHVAIRALNKPSSADAWVPVCIRGIILIHPGFVHQERTQEEEECVPSIALDWRVADMLVELSMPKGLGKDHPYMNPLLQFAAGEVKHVPPKALVALAEKDILTYMGKQYAAALEKTGCSVDVLMSLGVGHAFFHFAPHLDEEQEEIFYQRVAHFISGN